VEKYYLNKNQIRNFMEKKLLKKLKQDQKNLKILSEGDLQSCVYFHLRSFIDNKKKKMTEWHVINKLPIGERKESKKFPDITIVYMNKKGKIVYSSFLIELKEDLFNIKPRRVSGDLKKLASLKKRNKDLEMNYFIYSVLDKKRTPKEINKSILDLCPKVLDGWLVPITVNIYGQKQYLREFDGFEKKLLKLRKYRSD